MTERLDDQGRSDKEHRLTDRLRDLLRAQYGGINDAFYGELDRIDAFGIQSAETRPVAKTERRLHGDRLTEVISWAETECAAFAKFPHAEKDAKSGYLWLLCQAILDLRDDVLESLRKAG